MAQLSDLPNEMLLSISSYLDKESILQTRLTSRQFAGLFRQVGLRQIFITPEKYFQHSISKRSELNDPSIHSIVVDPWYARRSFRHALSRCSVDFLLSLRLDLVELFPEADTLTVIWPLYCDYSRYHSDQQEVMTQDSYVINSIGAAIRDRFQHRLAKKSYRSITLVNLALQKDFSRTTYFRDNPRSQLPYGINPPVENCQRDAERITSSRMPDVGLHDNTFEKGNMEYIDKQAFHDDYRCHSEYGIHYQIAHFLPGTSRWLNDTMHELCLHWQFMLDPWNRATEYWLPDTPLWSARNFCFTHQLRFLTDLALHCDVYWSIKDEDDISIHLRSIKSLSLRGHVFKSQKQMNSILSLGTTLERLCLDASSILYLVAFYNNEEVQDFAQGNEYRRLTGRSDYKFGSELRWCQFFDRLADSLPKLQEFALGADMRTDPVMRLRNRSTLSTRLLASRYIVFDQEWCEGNSNLSPDHPVAWISNPKHFANARTWRSINGTLRGDWDGDAKQTPSRVDVDDDERNTSDEEQNPDEEGGSTDDDEGEEDESANPEENHNNNEAEDDDLSSEEDDILDILENSLEKELPAMAAALGLSLLNDEICLYIYTHIDSYQLAGSFNSNYNVMNQLTDYYADVANVLRDAEAFTCYRLTNKEAMNLIIKDPEYEILSVHECEEAADSDAMYFSTPLTRKRLRACITEFRRSDYVFGLNAAEHNADLEALERLQAILSKRRLESRRERV